MKARPPLCLYNRPSHVGEAFEPFPLLSRPSLSFQNHVMKYFCLLLLFAGACLAKAVEPLRPGIYTGVWMGSPYGIRTSGGVEIGIGTNQFASLSYSEIDAITGSPRVRYLPAQLVGRRVLRQRGSRTPALRAVRQGALESFRGWFRIGGRTVIFYADYSAPLPPEAD